MNSNNNYGRPPGRDRGYRPPQGNTLPRPQHGGPVGWDGAPPPHNIDNQPHQRRPNHPNQDPRFNSHERPRGHRPLDQQQQRPNYQSQDPGFTSREGARDHRPFNQRQHPNQGYYRLNSRAKSRDYPPFDQQQGQPNQHNQDPQLNSRQGSRYDHRQQHPQQQGSNLNAEPRYNSSREGIRDHRSYDQTKRQKTGHPSSGDNNNSNNYGGNNNATHSHPQGNISGQSAQTKAVEITQNPPDATRIEAEQTSASAATTPASTIIDLTNTTTTENEKSDPAIDDNDEYLPFRHVATGYWNCPKILQEKLIAAYPSDAQALQKLPPHSYEPDFKERLQRSYTAVIRKVQAEEAMLPPASRRYDDSSDEDDSDDDYERVDMTAAVPTDPVLAQRKLLKQVAENPAVHFGFQCYCAKAFDKWCSCPIAGCKSYMFRPSELVDHLIAKKTSDYHDLILDFLKALYSNVYHDGDDKKYDHEGITKDIKERTGFVRVRTAEEYCLLDNGIEEENALIDSFHTLKLQLVESQQKINEKLAARLKLDAMEKALEQEKKERIMKRAFFELLPEITANDKKCSLETYTSRVEVFEQYLDSDFNDSVYNVTIILTRSFDVRESFLTWRKRCKKHKSKFNYHCTHCYMNTMLLDDKNAEFSFELTYTIGFRVKKDGVLLEKKEGAKAFLSEVWGQLSRLFFQRSGNFFEPRKDELLETQKWESVWMFRAIGRLIAFSLMQGIPVPRNILPPLIWVHLFRETDYLETDNCFQNFAFQKRANEKSDVEELCKAYDVLPLGENEGYDSFLNRLTSTLLEHAKTEEKLYRSARKLSLAALKDGFEYAQVPFDSKDKYKADLHERMSFYVRDYVASDPWTAVVSILEGEYAEEEDEE